MKRKFRTLEEIAEIVQRYHELFPDNQPGDMRVYCELADIPPTTMWNYLNRDYNKNGFQDNKERPLVISAKPPKQEYKMSKSQLSMGEKRAFVRAFLASPPEITLKQFADEHHVIATTARGWFKQCGKDFNKIKARRAQSNNPQAQARPATIRKHKPDLQQSAVGTETVITVRGFELVISEAALKVFTDGQLRTVVYP